MCDGETGVLLENFINNEKQDVSIKQRYTRIQG